jgi:hypothetical protein
MASHFECVGFPFGRAEDSGEGMREVVRRLFEEGRPLAAPSGFHAVEWGAEGGAGASAAVFVDPEAGGLELRCLTPTFLGAGRQRMRVYRTIPDAGCPFCDFLHGEVLAGGAGKGEPLFLEIEDPRWSRDLDLRGAEVVVQASLLAQHVHAYGDREEFLARRPDPFGPEAIFALGLAGMPFRPRARLAGPVLGTRRIENPLTGLPFLQATVGAFGGPWDVLAAPADLREGLREGQWLLADGTLVARFPEGLPG